MIPATAWLSLKNMMCKASHMHTHTHTNAVCIISFMRIPRTGKYNLWEIEVRKRLSPSRGGGLGRDSGSFSGGENVPYFVFGGNGQV